MNETVGHTAMGMPNKRNLDDSQSDLEVPVKRPRYHWYFRLESESSIASEEDTESVYSIQDKETDVVRDTSDTDTKSESGSSIGSGYEVEVEFEVASMSENEDNPLENCTTSDSDNCATENVIAAVLADSSLESWASDGEDSDTSDLEEFGRTDFWTCAQCKSKNNNPLYRLCEKCFQEKKNFYPPRPKRLRKKQRNAASNKVNVDRLRSCLSGLSQDSGLGSSQELGIDFEQIQVPSQRKRSAESESTCSTSRSWSRLRKISEAGGDSTEEEGRAVKGENLENFNKQKRRASVNGEPGGLREIKESKPENEDVETKTSVSLGEVVMKTAVELKDVMPSATENRNSVGVEDEDERKHDDVDLSREAIETKTGRTDEKNADDGKREEGVKALVKSTLNGNLQQCKELCIMCNGKSKNSAFLHGKSAHVCSCYQCAMRTWRTNRRCPVCNRKVSNVVKLYL